MSNKLVVINPAYLLVGCPTLANGNPLMHGVGVVISIILIMHSHLRDKCSLSDGGDWNSVMYFV